MCTPHANYLYLVNTQFAALIQHESLQSYSLHFPVSWHVAIRAGRSLKLPTPIPLRLRKLRIRIRLGSSLQSNFRIRICSVPDKILLLRMKLMLNTGTKCLGVTLILKAKPKLDYLGVLFQELRIECSRCFDVISRLLSVTSHSHIGVDAISYSRIVAQKYRYRFFSQLRLTQAKIQAGPE